MKLTVHKREGASKGSLRFIRRDGNIPAILYSEGKQGTPIAVDGKQLRAAIREMEKGHLPTTVFELDGDAAKAKALIKEVQYHPTSYDIIHVDLMELKQDREIYANVPVDCIGVVDCVGIKLGGFLREVTRHIRVRCLPKALPSHFTANVSRLGVKQSLRARDIAFPQGVKPLIDENQVVVTIAKK